MYLVLALLEEGPGHGYGLIRCVEERSGGLYVPSPGAMYPVLRALEGGGRVAARSDGGRRVYEITLRGREQLAEHGREAGDVWERAWVSWAPEFADEFRGLRRELRGTVRLVARRIRSGGADAEKLRRVREEASAFAARVADLLEERSPDGG